MDNSELAAILYEIADILEMQGTQFKPAAYRNAAREVESLSQDINEVNRQGKLAELPAIGKSIAEKIKELLETGHLVYLEGLKKNLPMDYEELLSVPGIGPKKVKLFYDKLKIRNVKELELAAKNHLIRAIPKMGEKSEQDILNSIEFSKRSSQRQPLGVVLPFANSIVEELKPFARQLVVAGSLRRMKETVADVDILATSGDPALLTNAFAHLKQVERLLARGPTKASATMENGLQLDIRVLDVTQFGSALNYFTGSKEHNVRLRQIAISKKMKLSEYGVFDRSGKVLASKTEEDVYKVLGMDYIEPELRENRGEIEAAQKHALPNLVSYSDIQGDLHLHTNWSDGLNSLEEMAKECARLKYGYIGITDHAGSLKVAHSLEEKQIDRQRKEIDYMQKKFNIRIFQGLEVNIKDDGTLDVPVQILKEMDFVIASVHSGWNNSKDKITTRVCRALDNKYVTFIGHPTGRLINERKPFDIDLDKLFEKAAETGKYFEINAHPNRLDLNDINSRAAIKMGIKLLINTDSHNNNQLDCMRYGVATARRGWCEKKDILNTLPLEQFEKFLMK